MVDESTGRLIRKAKNDAIFTKIATRPQTNNTASNVVLWEPRRIYYTGFIHVVQ